jgi:1-acyl-sn-glycerol-3-phosphate acyltransferase
MKRLAKLLFFGLLVKPLVLIVLGLNVRGREHLPRRGPAVIAANHNSHLDVLVLMSLFPLSQLHRVRPVAAADYFLRNPLISWFSRTCICIIPIDRSGHADQDALFSDCQQALDQNEILIIFPEGSRGDPEKISKIRKGIFYLLKQRLDTPVIPVVMHGLGRALPRGEALLVPFNCDVVVGEALPRPESAAQLTRQLGEAFSAQLELCVTRRDAD